MNFSAVRYYANLTQEKHNATELHTSEDTFSLPTDFRNIHIYDILGSDSWKCPLIGGKMCDFCLKCHILGYYKTTRGHLITKFYKRNFLKSKVGSVSSDYLYIARFTPCVFWPNLPNNGPKKKRFFFVKIGYTGYDSVKQKFYWI